MDRHPPNRAPAAPRLDPASAAVLRRARELSAELEVIVAAVRAHLAEQPEPPAQPRSRRGLAAGELRAAFAAARARAAPARRPRRLDTLGNDPARP